MNTQARRLRCSAAVLRRPHLPHNWAPQPGMEPVHCPGVVDALEQTRDLLRNENQRADKAIERETALEEELGMIRATVLREAADECDEAGSAYTARAQNDHAAGAFALMEHFLRKANEAEYAATPCSPGGCEDGGEPCTTHERLMSHADGEHELCGDEMPRPPHPCCLIRNRPATTGNRRRSQRGEPDDRDPATPSDRPACA
ncbi:hypothetical protein ABT010_13255 [Streptomyces sp. NPDC002668]|uniref:hypothetical protein n=1 Tax=Streptomyces sp. NPDC002668 TaxID=3154422 RepID=UPI00331FF82A